MFKTTSTNSTPSSPCLQRRSYARAFTVTIVLFLIQLKDQTSSLCTISHRRDRYLWRWGYETEEKEKKTKKLRLAIDQVMFLLSNPSLCHPARKPGIRFGDPCHRVSLSFDGSGWSLIYTLMTKLHADALGANLTRRMYIHMYVE